MSWMMYAPYVPVAARKAQAAKAIEKLNKKGAQLEPVQIEGRKIANTFWGKAWCDNLESYSDYENRLPRGRAYVRNGSVLDLKIEKGIIRARVQGSRLYSGEIKIKPIETSAWNRIKDECAGKIDSLVELLRGRLSDSVMSVITRQNGGLFPKPSEITLNCSCPDWADLCKHLASALYGVGARLDRRPELLFLLRGVDAAELVAGAAYGAIAAGQGESTLEGDLSEVFGIEIAGGAPAPEDATPKPKKTSPRSRGVVPAKKAVAPKKKAAKIVPAKTKKKPVRTATPTIKAAKPAAVISAKPKKSSQPVAAAKPNKKTRVTAKSAATKKAVASKRK